MNNMDKLLGNPASYKVTLTRTRPIPGDGARLKEHHQSTSRQKLFADNRKPQVVSLDRSLSMTPVALDANYNVFLSSGTMNVKNYSL